MQHFVLLVTRNYNTKATTKNNLALPKYKRVSGCRTFHTSAVRLWNQYRWGVIFESTRQPPSKLMHFRLNTNQFFLTSTLKRLSRIVLYPFKHEEVKSSNGEAH